MNLEQGKKGKIICATSESKNIMGVFSAVIYIDDQNNAKCIKYNYIKNLKNASEWPIYTLKFVADLNSDNKNEIIIQEISEFKVKYDVIEYRNNNFYEVLSSEIKI
ncbi:hypothetical protein D3C71_1841150 [compost metagenome]